MFIANQTKKKERLFRRMKVKLRAAWCWFSKDVKGQKVAQVTRLENILRIRRFIYPSFSGDV